MFKTRLLILLVTLLTVVPTSLADDRRRIESVWKLVSQAVEIQATGEKEFPLGRNPEGFVMFTPEGRATFILTAEGRKPAKTVDERAHLHNTLVAYTGAYRMQLRLSNSEGGTAPERER